MLKYGGYKGLSHARVAEMFIVDRAEARKKEKFVLSAEIIYSGVRTCVHGQPYIVPSE